MDRRENAGIFRSSARAGQVHSVTMSQDAGCDLMPEKKRKQSRAGRKKRCSQQRGEETSLLGVFGNCFSFLFAKSHFRQPNQPASMMMLTPGDVKRESFVDACFRPRRKKA